MKDLAGRLAVITGAAAGIGRGLAQALADAGAHLVLADLDAEGLDETRSLLPPGAPVQIVPTDVRDPAAIEALAEVASAQRPVQLLCNNAGVACGGVVWEQSLEDWKWLLDVNVMGVVHGLRSFVPRMLAHGEPAHIVNTASMMGLLTAPGLGAYAASKHAVIAISEALRHDLTARGAGIGVSVLCPGPVATRVHEERTRPEASRRAAASDPSLVAQREAIRALMAASPSAQAVGSCVVDAVRDSRFFVFSHPEQVSGIESRYAEMSVHTE